MHSIQDECVVISSVDYGDADRMVTLLTSKHGRVSAFAVGARKSKKRFGGALEPGTYATALWTDKKKDTVWLDRLDVLQPFRTLREDLALIARSAYALELCREVVREREPNPQVFQLLVEYLSALDARHAGPTSLLAFELEVLTHAGFMPRFSSCALCGNVPQNICIFDPSHGGVVCQNCSQRATHGVRTDAKLMQALRNLQLGAREAMSAVMRSQARELLNEFISHHLGRRLKSADFMRQIGMD